MARVPLQIGGQARNRAQGVCLALQGNSLGGPWTQQMVVLVAMLCAGAGQSKMSQGESAWSRSRWGPGVYFQRPLQVESTGCTYSSKTRCDNACAVRSTGVSWRPGAQGCHWGPIMRGPLPGTYQVLDSRRTPVMNHVFAQAVYGQGAPRVQFQRHT